MPIIRLRFTQRQQQLDSSMAKPVFWFDIDGTITDDGDVAQIMDGCLLGNALFDLLLAMIVEQGRDETEARNAILQLAEEILFWDYPDFIDAFELPADEAWRRMRAWHRRHLVVYADAVTAVRGLAAAGHAVHIMTNNPYTGALLKLERAGLCSLANTAPFAWIHCSNLHRGQKGREEYWRRAVTATGLPREDIVMIGDHPHEDCAVPRQAGITRSVLVDRAQVEPVRKNGAAVVVNSLERVLELDL